MLKSGGGGFTLLICLLKELWGGVLKLLMLSLGLLFVAACVQTQSQSPKWIYSGLDRNSYGRLHVRVDRDTHSIVSPPLCDPESRKHQGSMTEELSLTIVDTIFSPFDGGCKIDEAIIKENLQDHFRLPGDPVGGPLVSILDRDENRIVFWHKADLVPLKEVVNAAETYFSRMNKTVIYEGTARKCSSPQKKLVKIEGTSNTMISTYMISSFRCADHEIDMPIAQQPETIKNHTDLVRDVQNELIRLGYLAWGQADGQLGPKTKGAIVKFQANTQIPMDGLPTQSLLNTLRSN